MDKQSADILRRAKALIDRPEKWNHGPEAIKGDAICVGCALLRAYRSIVGDQDWPSHAAFRAQFAKLAGIGISSMDTISFNEAPATTHADVMAAFDRAIALAEGRISDEAYTARFISEVVESVKSQEVATAKP